MKIFIKITNLSQVLKIYADDEENEVFVNDSPVNYDAKKFVGEISAITFNWDENYFNNTFLDGEEFRIKLVNNNKERLISGKNFFPSNYRDFKQLINEVINLWN